MAELGGPPGRGPGFGRGGPAFGRDWTTGNVLRNLWSLSWPMIVASSFTMLGPIIDMIWVGKLGVASIAGVGVAGMGVWMMMSAMLGLGMGMRAMIARFVGSDDVEGANHVAQQAFVVSAAFSIVVAAIGIFLAEPMLAVLGVEAEVVAEGAAYLRIMFVGSVFMSFGMMAVGIMQASGDVVTPMKITIASRLFHVALVPFLIFGWWLFPRLGVSGAALTNVISGSLGMALGLWVLFSGRSRLRLTLRNFRLDRDIIWRMVKIGIPASITNIQWALGDVVLMWIIVPFGTFAVAAHTVVQRIEMFLFMPGMGFGMASGVLVGQNLGAGQPERAEKSGWLAVGLAQAVMVIGAVVVLLWAESLVRVFSTEPGVVEIASTFLKIAAAGYLVMGIAVVVSSVLSGAGDTVPPMVIQLSGVWLVQLPLAYLLPRVTTLGIYGVRWAMVIALAMRTVAYVIYFRLGRWKRKRV